MHSATYREVVYCPYYSGFHLPREVLVLLYQQHRDIFPTIDSHYFCEEEEFLNGTSKKLYVRDERGIVRDLNGRGLVRHDPRLIEIIKSVGLGQTLAITEVPAGYDYKIDEYDSSESVDIFPDYKGIIADLVAYYQTGSREFRCPITQQVIDGSITL